MSEIDFVVTWVDGSDPVWQAEKRKHGGDAAKADGGEANSECRYRDCGLLKYWFRSVERFAPWVNRVFFVTCGQKPDWLNESNPKLVLVNHREYIPPEHLPTFNSNTIELNLHRIRELSEHFVLFNDDMFLLRPVTPAHFFRNGLPVLSCDLGVPAWLGYNPATHIVLNNSGILRRSLDVERLVWRNMAKFVNVRALGLSRAAKNLLAFAINRMWIAGSFGHVPLPHLKSTFEEMWQKATPGVLERTSSSRFRMEWCVNHWMACGWNMVNGRFYPANEKRYGKSVAVNDDTVESICNAIKTQAYLQLCINDSDRITDPECAFKRLAQAFDVILPEKSSFEKC